MLLYGMIGACIAGVPLALLLLYQSYCNTGLKQQVNDYRKWEKHGLYLHVWTLKEDIAAGEKLTRADLEKQKMWILETDGIRLAVDIDQLTGKRAKKALTKGMVISADLLSDKKQNKETAGKP